MKRRPPCCPPSGSDPGDYRAEREHGIPVMLWLAVGICTAAILVSIWRGCTAPRFDIPAEAGRTQQEASRR